MQCQTGQFSEGIRVCVRCSVRQVSSLKVLECVLVQCQTGQFSEGIRVCVRCSVRQVSSLKVSECVLALHLVYHEYTIITLLLRMANSVDLDQTAENGKQCRP